MRNYSNMSRAAGLRGALLSVSSSSSDDEVEEEVPEAVPLQPKGTEAVPQQLKGTPEAAAEHEDAPAPLPEPIRRPPPFMTRDSSRESLLAAVVKKVRVAEQWTVSSWVASIPAVTEAIASALLESNSSGLMEREFVRGLGKQETTAKQMRSMLESGTLLDKLSEELARAAQAFSKQRAATAHELHEKFLSESDSLKRMKFGELSQFYRGLEGVVGPPCTDLEMGMLREHTKCRDSQIMFEAPNYGTLTTVRR